MMRGGLVACVGACALSAACLRDPVFTPRDAAVDAGTTDQDVVVMGTGTGEGAIATAPGYRLAFANGGAHFPYELSVAGTPMLELGENCLDERGAGLALYPSLLVNGEDYANVAGTLSIDFAGPVIGRVEIAWTAASTCTDGTGMLIGSTTFTLFPDGRINRWDRVRMDTALAPGGCMGCGATSDAAFYLTSYMVLSADNVMGTEVEGAMGDETSLQSYGAEIVATTEACLASRQRHVAFGWPDTQTRVRVAREAPRALAFVYDFYENDTLPAFDRDLRTTMLVGSQDTSCAQLLQRMQLHLSPLSLHIARQGDVGSPTGIAKDGIFGGEDASGKRGYDVPGVPGVPVILSIPSAAPSITQGFAVWLELATFHEDFVVTRSGGGAGTGWYRWQRAKNADGADTTVVFWFADGLMTGETITIDPVGP